VKVSDAAPERLLEAAAGGEERYEVADELGRGGMGTVYRARDRVLGRDVALKVLAEEAKEGAADRLRREAAILARLEHPGIVPIHDVGTLADGRVFYAMKLVKGERLDSFAAHASADEILRALERVSETVAFAHAHGVVHRDLKPANLMAGEFGEVLVLDWGVAKVLGETEHEDAAAPSRRAGTAHGTVLGTPGYMAPEQERGETVRLDARADVFALGRVLAELLPAGASSGPRSRALAAVAAKAAAASPQDRYPGAGELAAEIARVRAGLPVLARKESALERAARFLARHRLALILVATYLLVRVGLVLVQLSRR
jgi:serine/threonine protein kinase